MTVLIDSIALVVLILGWWAATANYPYLPESIPVHFRLTGEADGWGKRWMIVLTPTIAALIFAFDWFLIFRLAGTSRMSPRMVLPLHLLLLELTILFAFITWRMSEVAFGRAKGLGEWFLPVVLLGVFGTSAWIIIASKTQ